MVCHPGESKGRPFGQERVSQAFYSELIVPDPQEIGYFDEDGYEKFWSESHVSEGEWIEHTSPKQVRIWCWKC